jgi:hypothetical protein
VGQPFGGADLASFAIDLVTTAGVSVMGDPRVGPSRTASWSGGRNVSAASSQGVLLKRMRVTLALRDALADIKYGRAEDSYGWLRRVV